MTTLSDLIAASYYVVGFGSEVKNIANPYILSTGGGNWSVGVMQEDFHARAISTSSGAPASVRV